MRHFLTILFITFGLFELQAVPKVTRNYAYRYYTKRDGLVDMQVLCAFQDKDGYMWFGTKGGVSRFDGVSFKNLTQEDGIPIGDMYAVGEWGYKKLFFYAYQFQILHENDSLELIKIPDNLIFSNCSFLHIPISDNEILLLNLIDPKIIPVHNYYHLIWNKNTHSFRRWKSIDKSILAYNDNYLITENAIYSRKGLNVAKLDSFNEKYTSAQVDWKSGDIYLRSEISHCLDKYNFKNNKLIFCATIAKNGQHYFFSLLPDKTILYFTREFEPHFVPDRPTKLGVELAYLEKSYVDREGNLWITSNNGIYNFFNLNFEEFTFNLAKPDNIWSVLEDNDYNMWFGSYGWGLWRMNKEGVLKAENRNFKDWQRQYMGSTRSKDGTLFMPTSGGVSVYKNGKFTNLFTGVSLSVFCDKITNQIYYSGFNAKTGSRGLWIGIDASKKYIPWKKGFPIALGKDSKGRIRVGSFHGQGYVQGDSIIVTDTLKRPYEGVLSYTLDKWGRFWKATTKGFYMEMPNGKEFRFAPQIKGVVGALWNYHDKYLLMGTGTGMAIALLRSDMLKNPTIWEVGYDAGFTGLDTGQNAFFEDHNGDMWVWTSLNVLKFNPDKLVQSQMHYIPSLRIAGLDYSKNNTNWNSVLFDNKSVEIKSSNKFLRIGYIANSISAPQSLRFKYRLIGFSDKWSEPVYTKYVSYTNIGYGKYSFEVQCSLDGIHWSQVVKSPVIQIIAPVYLRPVAFLFYLILIIALSIHLTQVIVKSNQQKKLKELDRQKLENELQLNTLRSKVIPHFTKNVLSAIGYFAMTDKLKAGHYISLFSDFTQSTLTNADKNYISLNEELSYMRNYLELEKMRFDDKFDYQISIEDGICTDILVPSMTLHTYCDNAIRHGLVNKQGDGLLVVSVTKNHNNIIIKVTDNGIGRVYAQELGTRGNGQGLKLIQAQIDFYNQINPYSIVQIITDLYDESGRGCGTTVELHIPDGYSFIR